MLKSLKQKFQAKVTQFKNLEKKKKIRYIVFFLMVIAALIAFVLYSQQEKQKQEQDQQEKQSYHIALGEAALSPGETVTVDVLAGQFPGDYPALSFELDFDPTQLEFLSLKQGNITIENQTTKEKVLPEWNFQKELVNRDGRIRTMYLDMTAGEVPFNFSKVTDEKNVLFRIECKVRDSVSKGDTVNLSFTQATFATIDEDNSLSMQKQNVTYQDGCYVAE